MRYLMDTQIAIWAKENNPRLTSRVKIILEDSQNDILVSQFSLIELSIKLKIGKLPNFIISIEAFADALINDGFDILPITNQQIFSYQQIPFFDDHRDPFDRYILSTAFANDLTLITADDKFDRYCSIVDVIKI